MIRRPSASALASFDPAPGPAATKSVFFETLDAAFPPACTMASNAPSRVNPSREPVATTVTPERTPPAATAAPGPGWPGVAHCTPAAVHSSTISRCQSISNQAMRASAMIPPTPSTSASSSRLAARMASSEPKYSASDLAATGPTCRMFSATSKRASGRVLAASRLASSSTAFFEGTEDSSPSNSDASGSCTPSFFARRRRNGVTRFSEPSSLSFGRPVSLSRTTTVTGKRSAIVSEKSPASVVSGGSAGSRGCVSAAAATSPSASTSSAPREPMCSTRPRTCAGQLRAFGQRRSMSPSFAGASVVPHSGQSSGITNSRSEPSRSSTTGPRTSGMTSPALRRTTVSPMSTPFAFTTSWLCSVAWRTSLPATRTFSMTAKGVARPVRPTLTTMSRSLVFTCSGGYL